MRRLLIITGTYYPAVLADTHRARLLAPGLKSCGWDAEILAAGAEFLRPDAVETDSAPFFDPTIAVHFAHPHWDGLFKLLNMRSIGWRAFLPLYLTGAKLLSRKRFDLVYITTAQFNLFLLGWLWRRRFGVPYILDFHDPWVREDGASYATTTHKFKLLLSRFFAKPLEKFAVQGAAGLVSVSPTYIAQLRRRYPKARSLKDERTQVIPFSAAESDLAAAPMKPVEGVDLEIVYVGAGGRIMEKSWRALLCLLSNLAARRLQLLSRLRFKFFGTEAFWREGDKKFLVEVAREYGLAHLVEEHPQRVSYLRAMEMIQSSAGLLILGVDDPAYMPSKLFTYSLTGKPLLVSLHRDSQANRYFQEIPQLGHLVHFDDDRNVSPDDELTIGAFLEEVQAQKRFERKRELEPYLSPAAARKHAEFFERVLST